MPSADVLTSVAAALLSLAMSYIPGLKDWYAPLTDANKKIIMLVLVLVATIGSLAYACGSADGELTACFAKNWLDYLRVFLLAVGVNQGVYRITRPK